MINTYEIHAMLEASNLSNKEKTLCQLTNIYAYTYLIGWSNLDLWYYGVRYAQTNRKRDYDLWTDYFTHSKPVKHMRAFIGEPDVIHYDKIFDSIDEARKYESKALTEHNAKESIHWLNKHDKLSPPSMIGNENGMYGREHSKESINKIKESKKNISSFTIEKYKKANKGKNNPNYGKAAPNRKKVKIKGIIYNSKREAAKKLKVSERTIHYWIQYNKAENIN